MDYNISFAREPQIFACACMAVRYRPTLEVQCFACGGDFDSEEEAQKYAIERCLKRFPISEEWTQHRATTAEIPLKMAIQVDGQEPVWSSEGSKETG